MCDICICYCEGLAWLKARCPPKPLSLPLLNWTGRKYTTKDSWVKIRTGRDHSPTTVMGKTDSIWGS